MDAKMAILEPVESSLNFCDTDSGGGEVRVCLTSESPLEWSDLNKVLVRGDRNLRRGFDALEAPRMIAVSVLTYIPVSVVDIHIGDVHVERGLRVINCATCPFYSIGRGRISTTPRA